MIQEATGQIMAINNRIEGKEGDGYRQKRIIMHRYY